VGKTLDSGDNF